MVKKSTKKFGGLKNYPYICIVNQLNINKMKKQFFILSIVGLIGQLSSLLGILTANNNDQILLSLYCFSLFGIVGVIGVIMGDKLPKKLPN